MITKTATIIMEQTVQQKYEYDRDFQQNTNQTDHVLEILTTHAVFKTQLAASHLQKITKS